MTETTIGATKICRECGETKPLDGFYPRRDSPDGLRNDCRACQNKRSKAYHKENRDKVKAQRAQRYAVDTAFRGEKIEAARRWVEENPKRVLIRHLKKYGLTMEQYEALYEKQGGVCAICERQETAIHASSGRPKRLSIDHCHKTGKVRGLLCRRCNQALGMCEDDPDLLRTMIEYVVAHQ